MQVGELALREGPGGLGRDGAQAFRLDLIIFRYVYVLVVFFFLLLFLFVNRCGNVGKPTPREGDYERSRARPMFRSSLPSGVVRGGLK